MNFFFFFIFFLFLSFTTAIPVNQQPSQPYQALNKRSNTHRESIICTNERTNFSPNGCCIYRTDAIHRKQIVNSGECIKLSQPQEAGHGWNNWNLHLENACCACYATDNCRNPIQSFYNFSREETFQHVTSRMMFKSCRCSSDLQGCRKEGVWPPPAKDLKWPEPNHCPESHPGAGVCLRQ